MRLKLWRILICCVDSYKEKFPYNLCDHHYFETPQEVDDAYHMMYKHYGYRRRLFNRNEIFNIKIEKWINPQSTLPTGRWIEVTLKDLYKSDEELY